MLMLRKSNMAINLLNKSFWDLPTSSNISYFWNFGSMLGICLIIQIMSGLLLTFHYTSYSQESFSSIIIIMKEVWSGSILRLIHMNSASMFFLFIYFHLMRGIYYNSSKNKNLWMSGVMILMVLMMISFLGYVLPWGQMSYWAVAVITNLFSIIPIVGVQVVEWIWGGFSVGSPTLTRFFSLHFLTPMILTVMVMIHLIFLHNNGSSSSIGLKSNLDKIYFHPYFSIKDTLFILLMIMMMIMMCMITPYITLDPTNNIPSNPMKTPTHIQPEWYFLTSYAILRAMPNKILGVLALILSILIYMTMIIGKMKFSTKFTLYRQMMFWILVSSFLILLKLGSMSAEEPFITMSMIWSSIYFTTIVLINL